MTSPAPESAGPAVAARTGAVRGAVRGAEPAARHAIHLHIGTLKSGTTFIQRVLSHHRDLLGTHGVLFPGGPTPSQHAPDLAARHLAETGEPSAGDYGRQVAAVRDAIDLRGPLSVAEVEGAWSELCGDVAAWPGSSAIVSVEQLSLGRRAQIRTIVDSLAPADVHVVLTARDLARVVPSSWQETVQNGLTWTWHEYVDSVRRPPDARDAAATRFWRQHDVLSIVDRWTDVVGPHRLQVVTVPRDDAPPGQLWRRFCVAVGLDATQYSLEGFGQPANTSLDRDAAEFLRLLNVRLEMPTGDKLPMAQYVQHVKRPLAKRALARLPSRHPIALSAADLAWATEQGELVAAGLAQRKVAVIGHLRELVPVEPARTQPDHPAGAERVAELAVRAAAALSRELAKSPAGDRAARRRARTGVERRADRPPRDPA